MSKRIVWAVCGLLMLMSGGAARAQALADKVPAGVMFYAGWNGAESMGPGFEGSKFQGLLKTVDLNGLGGQVMQAAHRLGKPTDVGTLELIQTLVPRVWNKPTAIYMASRGHDDFEAMAIVDVGADAATLRDRLRALKGDATVRIEAEGEYLLAGSESCAPLMKATMQLIRGEAAAAKALAGDVRFRSAIEGTGLHPAAAVYVDVDAVNKAVEEQVEPENLASMRGVRDALGLGGIHRVVWAGGFEDGGWAERAFIDAPAPRKGLAALFDGGAITPEVLNLAPADSPWVSASRLNLTKLFEAVENATEKAGPDAKRSFDEGLEKLRQQAGFDVEKDLLGSMGNLWVSYHLPFGGFVAVCPLKDPVRFSAAMEKATAQVKQGLDEMVRHEPQGGMLFAPKVGLMEFEGLRIHTVGFMMAGVSWMVHDGKLYIGQLPQSLISVAQAKADRPGITTDASYQAVMKRLNVANACEVNYADLRKTGPVSYQSLLAMVQMAQGMMARNGQQVQLILPPLERIMPYFEPAGSVTWTDASGVHTRGYGPFPGATMMAGPGGLQAVAVGGLTVGILLPSLGRARAVADRTVSAANLSGIYKSMYMWSVTHDGAFPPDLGTLAKEGAITPKMVINPRVHKVEPPKGLSPDQLAAWVNDHSDYVYITPNKGANERADHVMIYEKIQPGVKEGINLCFGDGHVAFTPMVEARRLLKEVGVTLPASAK